MKEEASQVRRLRKHPIHRCAVPLPQWGRLRNENTVFLDTTPFPIGKAKRRRLRRPKRKPTPPRCARPPLPREGAHVDTPSFLWKEVPRRGGGWMGESGVKKSEEMRLKSTIYESTLSTADAVPLPQWGRLRNENTVPPAKPSPRGEGGERSEPDRVLAV